MQHENTANQLLGAILAIIALTSAINFATVIESFRFYFVENKALSTVGVVFLGQCLACFAGWEVARMPFGKASIVIVALFSYCIYTFNVYIHLIPKFIGFQPAWIGQHALEFSQLLGVTSLIASILLVFAKRQTS